MLYGCKGQRVNVHVRSLGGEPGHAGDEANSFFTLLLKLAHTTCLKQLVTSWLYLHPIGVDTHIFVLELETLTVVNSVSTPDRTLKPRDRACSGKIYQ